MSEAEFGEQVLLSHPGGSFDWTLLSEDLSLPADPPAPTELNAPRALRLFVRHGPRSGAGAC